MLDVSTCMGSACDVSSHAAHAHLCSCLEELGNQVAVNVCMQASAEQSAATGERDTSARLLTEAEARAEAAEEVASELRAAIEQQQADFSHRWISCTRA